MAKGKKGLERDEGGKVFYKKFLFPYGMIAYIKDKLEEAMVVNAKGNLRYATYNDVTQVKKSIVLCFPRLITVVNSLPASI